MPHPARVDSGGDITVEDLAQIDALCDRFEADWLGGVEPDLAEYLRGTSGPARSRLFREILALDLEYRLARGESPGPSAYRERFPDDLDAIDAGFATSANTPGPAPGPSPRLKGGTFPDNWPTLPGSGLTPAGLSQAVLDALEAAGYEVLGELGRGGMGVVYLARKVVLNRLCALKMILAGAHAGSAVSERFRCEAEAVARLRHPDIVQIYHVGEADGLPFLELEYFPGGSLDRVLDGSPRPPLQAVRLVEILSRAIAEAHRQGVVHRDIKPANILLDSGGRPKVADFGLAKVLDTKDGLTKTHMVLGSPSYMAPEQADGRSRRVGATTDVYALGAVLYELLTGRPPFRGASALETLEQVKWAEPVSPSRLVPGLPRDVETVCLKCLEKAPAARYPAAEALADDLRRFAAGEPIQAHPAAAWTRARKWAERRPALATALSVGGAAVGLLLAGTLYYNARLRAEVHRARSAEQAALAQRNLALGAYDRLVYDVQEGLGETAATRPFRQSLLGAAIEGLDQLARGAEASAPDLSRAVAHQKLGALYRQVGRADDAYRQFGLARVLAERLIAADPGGLANKECLRDVDTGLGELNVRRGRLAEAKGHLRRAVALAEEVVQAGPKRSGARPALLAAYFQFGRARGFGGESGQAEALYRRMHDLAELWVADEPGNSQARNLLAMSYRKLGDAKKLANDHAAARRDYRQAIEIGRAIVSGEPGNLGARYQLALALDDLGGVLAVQGSTDEARSSYVEAEGIFRSLADADTDDLDTQTRIVLVQAHLARVERDSSRYDRAVDLLTQALERLRGLDRLGRLGGMPMSKAWLKEFSEDLSDCRKALAGGVNQPRPARAPG